MKSFKEYDLTLLNSYHVRATAAQIYFPESDDDIAEIFSDKTRRKIILGGGFNVIFSKPYYDDVDFVIFADNFGHCSIDGLTLTAQSGASLKQVSEMACDKGLTGLELFYDVPGTVGGAVFMNAETLGESFGDHIETVTGFDRKTQSFLTAQRDQLQFGYRTSVFQQYRDAVITGAKLVLKKGDKSAIYKKMMDNQAQRRAKQPWDLPNAGSVFKRPPGRFVGQMMDELNLKGTTCGGAMISPKHGGFIVNFNGHATGRDILNLIALIQEKVFAAYQIRLELEQRII
jgi:UDP-N-acetylmuramate dehydrogenase